MSTSHSQPGEASDGSDASALLHELRERAVRLLARMYLPQEKLFCFRLRRDETGGNPPRHVIEGISLRYTAIVLLALAREDSTLSEQIFGEHRIDQVLDRLIETALTSDELGSVALALWAARAWKREDADRLLEHLRKFDPLTGSHPTVEVAWCLTAQSIDGDSAGRDEPFARQLADRLMRSFSERSELFPHWPAGADAPWSRAHVSCYADLVYPIQALSHYSRFAQDPQALSVARRGADKMCALQGPQGQWWWHYDVRTGRLLEPFPVYAVHQDAMGPMALYDCQDAGGGDYRAAIRQSVLWFDNAPELTDFNLNDRSSDVIWRKVARNEPGKLTRSLQAMTSRIWSGMRAPGVNCLFKPGKVDFESRPYHMGWILYAFTTDRIGSL